MLNKVKLKNDLKKDIEKIENKLFNTLNDKTNGIYNVHKELDDYARNNLPITDYDAEAFKKNTWKKISEEWSKALSKQIISTLADELSEIISTRIDAYIKSASITIPPGQVVTTSRDTGATTAVSPQANIN